jgi:hypothetical protein
MISIPTAAIMGAMSRRFRAFAALAAVAAFLFAQGTMAAYACSGPVTDPVAMAQMKAQMGEDGGLCEKHCTTGTVSFELAKPGLSTMPAVAPVALRIVPVAEIFHAVHTRAEPLSVAGPAPPLIRFTVFRI